ncbi:MAG: hypothetical protein FJX25_11725 [Alphaproteobacteria bacterium]|nr:hypothetical protein [Alphaproteobacteria bacterium]
MTAKHIELDLGKTDPNLANDPLKIWRALLTLAKVEPNPALTGKRRAVRVIGFTAWDSDEPATFGARWPVGAPARAAFKLLYCTAPHHERCRDDRAEEHWPRRHPDIRAGQNRWAGLYAVVEPTA